MKITKDFASGLVVGVAVMAIVSFAVVSFMYFKNVNGVNTSNTTASIIDNTVADTDKVPDEPVYLDVEVADDDIYLGTADAPVTIVEFLDFDCPFCRREHEATKEILANYDGQVRWVYKHFPLTNLHENTELTSQAVECANDQSKLSEYLDALMAEENASTPELLDTIASDVGLDTATFSSCLDSEKYLDKIRADADYGSELGITGTPNLFINTRQVKGALPYDSLKKIIDENL